MEKKIDYNKIEYLGARNGWNKDHTEHCRDLMARWDAEYIKGLNVKRFSENTGRCENKYTYIFADGSGFCFEVDSSD